MALITLPSSPNKGVFQTYKLNQTELSDLIGDNYFKDIANWKKVVVTYVSAVSNQISIITFIPDEQGGEVSAIGFFAEQARTLFQISNISVYDKQNGRNRLNRNQIPEVELYDLSFVSTSAQAAFLGLDFQTGNYEQSAIFTHGSEANPSEVVVYGSPVNTAGSITTWEPVLNLPNGRMDDVSSLKLMEQNVSDSDYSQDFTKTWAAGQFGLTAYDKELPPLPPGDPFSGDYTENPTRLVELDMETSEVRFIADVIREPGLQETIVYSMVASEEERVIVVTQETIIAAYDMDTGERLWVKSFQSASTGDFSEDFSIGKKARDRMEVIGDSFVMAIRSFDGVEESNQLGLIKINLRTGQKDSSYSTPSLTNGKRLIWGVSPDKSKQVMVGQTDDGFLPVIVFNNGVASVVQYTNPESDYSAIAAYCTDSHVYIQTPGGIIRKYNYSGSIVEIVVRSDSGWDNVFGPRPHNGIVAKFAVYEGNIYSSARPSSDSESGQVLIKFNESNGNLDSNFYGINAMAGAKLGKIFFRENKLIVNRFSGGFNTINTTEYTSRTELSYQQGGISVFVVNTTTQDIVSSYRDEFTNVGFLLAQVSSVPATTPIHAEKIFLTAQSGVRVLARSEESMSLESEWPSVFQGTGAFPIDQVISGDFIYYICNLASTTWEDSQGLYDAGIMVRVNLNTKLIDRSFAPDYGSYQYNGGKLYATDNFIYLVDKRILRISKADSSVQEITGTDIGLSTPAFGFDPIYTFLNFQLRVQQITSGNIAIYLESFSPTAAGTRSEALDGKPYVIVNEATLQQTGVQPGIVESYGTDQMVYSLETNKFGAIEFDGQNRLLVNYDVATGSRSVASNILPRGTSDITGDELIGLKNMTVQGGSFFFGVSDKLRYKRKIYRGIVQMSPMGVIKN